MSSTITFHTGRTGDSDSGSARFGRSAFQPDQTIGDLRLVAPLGNGGMGEVWEAVELSMNRPVAVKFLSANRELRNVDLKRLQREAQAGGRLSHRGIVSVYSVHTGADPPHIVQELVPGGCTLADYLADIDPAEELPADYGRRLAELMVPILDALEFAHRAGVVHRDLKPQNVLITPEDEPKIADFGLAQLAGAETLTRTGEIAGTLSYMSPEQADGARKVPLDARTDVFSIGATMYELLTLQRAFPGSSSHEILWKILHTDPVDPRRLSPRTPEDLAVIVSKALEKKREDRFQTMGEFADELRRFLNHEPIRTKPPGPWKRFVKWMRRHPTATAALITAVAAAFIAAPLLIRAMFAEDAKARAEFDERMAEAMLALQVRDLGRATDALRDAIALDPEDPEPHLFLALAYSERGRFADVEACIARATDLGFDPTGATARTARDHWFVALHRIALRDPANFEAAERHLETALELDPDLRDARFSLYFIRVLMEDHAGALSALSEYRTYLPAAHPYYPMIEAREFELRGQWGEARRMVESVMARIGDDPEALDELRVFGTYGTVLFNLGDYDGAREALHMALEVNPEDCWSWDTLSAIRLMLFEETGDPGELEAASAMATRAKACSPFVEHAFVVDATAAIRACETAQQEPSLLSSATWKEAERSLTALEQRGAAGAAFERLRISLDTVEARFHFYADALPDARRAAERVIARDPSNVEIRIILAESLDDPNAPLGSRVFVQMKEHIDVALDAIRSSWLAAPVTPTGEDRRQYQIAVVWSYGASALLGDPDAENLKEDVLDELYEHPDFDRVELLNFADFLTRSSTDGGGACEALALIDEFGLRELRNGDQDAEDIFVRVETKCR